MKTCICVFLVAIIGIVFGQTLGHDFVNFDDKTYVYGNPVVTSGLTLPGIVWAFTHSHALNWHPLTTISHMLDVQLFGLNAGGHHFTSVLLHTIATILLFLVLYDMTSERAVADIGDAGREFEPNGQNRSRRQLWRCAFVAALFAIHPLHVESVAWIAERKDVLSAVFFMLTLGAYVRYTRKRTLGRYLTLSLLFACGLMSKPMLVTVPFVLLLLDYWPLGRAREQKTEARGQLLVEKIPLFLLSAVSCAITIVAQRGATGGMDQLPLIWRIENALASCVIYIGQMFWPANLAVFYPANPFSIWQAVLAVVVVCSLTAFAIATRKTRPYLFTGWFWYLGMLVPVIGVFQIGLQAHADRYTYLPQIGLYVAIAWTVSDLLKMPNVKSLPLNWAFGVGRWTLGVGCSLIIVVLAWCARDQTRYWKNSETLWTHTLAVTSDNDVAHNNLGQFFVENGQIDDAILQYRAALQIRFGAEEGRYKLSAALTHNNLGNALVRKDQLDEGVAEYQKAIFLRPDYADGHFNLGMALLQKGEVQPAMEEWQKTLAIHPNDAEAHGMIGDAFVRKHAIREAISHYEKVLGIEPRSVVTLNKLAWISSVSPNASLRDGARAIGLAQKANEYSGGKNPIIVRTLAAAYAETNQFDDAIKTAERAAELANLMGQPALAEMLEKDINLYGEKSPLRDFNLTDAEPPR